MKRTYIKPSVEVFNVSAVRMLAASQTFPGGVGGEENPDEKEQDGRDNNNPGGNLWDQVW